MAEKSKIEKKKKKEQTRSIMKHQPPNLRNWIGFLISEDYRRLTIVYQVRKIPTTVFTWRGGLRDESGKWPLYTSLCMAMKRAKA